jgi:hypothetical protein
MLMRAMVLNPNALVLIARVVLNPNALIEFQPVSFKMMENTSFWDNLEVGNPELDHSEGFFSKFKFF